MTHAASTPPHDAGWYEIRVQGRLDPRWSAWLDGVHLTPAATAPPSSPATSSTRRPCTGCCRLRDIGLPLISVARVDPEPGHTPTPTPPETDMSTTTTTVAAPTPAHHRAPARRPRPEATPAPPASSTCSPSPPPSPRCSCSTPCCNDPGYILGAGHDNQVLFACLLDIVTALTGIGSAVAVFPVVKRRQRVDGARASSCPAWSRRPSS